MLSLWWPDPRVLGEKAWETFHAGGNLFMVGLIIIGGLGFIGSLAVSAVQALKKKV